jgi:hypothetical protein
MVVMHNSFIKIKSAKIAVKPYFIVFFGKNIIVFYCTIRFMPFKELTYESPHGLSRSVIIY